TGLQDRIDEPVVERVAVGDEAGVDQAVQLGDADVRVHAGVLGVRLQAEEPGGHETLHRQRVARLVFERHRAVVEMQTGRQADLHTGFLTVEGTAVGEGAGTAELPDTAGGSPGTARAPTRPIVTAHPRRAMPRAAAVIFRHPQSFVTTPAWR